MTILHYLYTNTAFLHLSIILSVFILTYCRVLGKDFYWCIDDIEGIARFSETLDEKTKVKIDSYEVTAGKGKVKYLSFIPALGFPGCVLRFIRLHIGKHFREIGKNAKGHEVYGFAQSPVRHHAFSMLIQAACLVLGYFYLVSFLPAAIAFGACLLYAVHPLTTQTVGWISGVNYSISLMFSLALLNTAIYLHGPAVKYLLIMLLSFFAGITVYIGCFTPLVLLVHGLYADAFFAGIVALGILVFAGLKTRKYRSDNFKEQNMGHTLSLNWRKPLVMVKTIGYYMVHCLAPLHMGLYHTWGYFYEPPLERIDKRFFFGVFSIALLAGAFISGSFGIKLGVVWFLAYLFLFTNFITAQQFVADRYATVPAFGVCIILSVLLYGSPFFWVLVGLYAMRSFLHLPTFKNEVDFFLSNWLNFRKSEVSLGNLGVAYANQGMPGMAVDMWRLATQINPHYDVPWYNLYSVFKGQGRLQDAKDFLRKCLDAKVVHFEKRWNEEYVQLETLMQTQSSPLTGPASAVYQAAAEYYKANDHVHELECLEKFLASDTTGVIPIMIEEIKKRIGQIKSDNLVRDSLPKPEGPVTVGPHSVDSGSGLSQRQS